MAWTNARQFAKEKKLVTKYKPYHFANTKLLFIPLKVKIWNENQTTWTMTETKTTIEANQFISCNYAILEKSDIFDKYLLLLHIKMYLFVS